MLLKWLKLYRLNLKKSIEICGSFETLLVSEQQLTLYMYTCCHTYWEEEIYTFVFILTLSLILSFSRRSKKWVKHSNNWAVYISAYNNICLFLNCLCSTVHSFTLAMKQTGYWDVDFQPPSKCRVTFWKRAFKLHQDNVRINDQKLYYLYIYARICVIIRHIDIFIGPLKRTW